MNVCHTRPVSAITSVRYARHISLSLVCVRHSTALSTLIKLAANKLPCLVPILLKLLKKILLIAIRICYCVILYYLVYKHSCLLAYYSLIYIRIISRDRVAKKRIYLNIY
ncbi:hypothetical protein HBI47_104330 [Parastagonospora nodorum]|nr:hypothetical protein HBI47_104330 [Parastagonospora nodorum]